PCSPCNCEAKGETGSPPISHPVNCCGSFCDALASPQKRLESLLPIFSKLLNYFGNKKRQRTPNIRITLRAIEGQTKQIGISDGLRLPEQWVPTPGKP